MTPPRLTALVALVTGLLLLPSRLFGVHGVESALVLGLVLPPWVAAAAAWRWQQSMGRGVPRGERMCGQLRFALAAWAVPVVLLALNQLRLRNCAPWQGLGFMSLGPGVGVLLAALLGSLVADLLPRWRRWAVALAALCGSCGMVLGLLRLGLSPAVFVYDHLVGYFPGSFYDPGVQIPAEYLSFRAVSGLLGAGLWGLLWERLAAAEGRPWRGPAAWLWAAALLLTLVVAEQHGAALGHRSDAGFMARQLGGVGHGQRCSVHVPREMPAGDRRLLVGDCDFRVRQAERTLGARQRRRLHAYFFRDAAEKRRLMGAAQTNIAKPWRHEVYLLVDAWPHPILAHEVAHVVAGNLAPAPLHIAARAGGLLPEPTLIEGMAVAAAWTASDELTPHGWAKALLQAGRLPHLQSMLGLRFLLFPARSAYTAAGSWLRFILETRGQAALARVYRLGDPAAALGKPIAQLDAEWRAFLRHQPLPPAAQAIAASKFARTSLFTATCPHRVALLQADLAQDLKAGDWPAVRRSCAGILALDPDDAAALPLALAAQAQAGELGAAARGVQALGLRYGAASPLHLAAAQGLADALWQRDDAAQAEAGYRALLPHLQADSLARGIDIKLAALARGGEAAALVRSLLVGVQGRSPPPRFTVHLMHRLLGLAEAQGDAQLGAISAYLLARQLLQDGQHAAALPLLQQAAAQGLPSERLRRENRALLGAAQVATGALDAARGLWTGELQAAPAGSGRAAVAQDWLQRLALLNENRG